MTNPDPPVAETVDFEAEAVKIAKLRIENPGWSMTLGEQLVLAKQHLALLARAEAAEERERGLREALLEIKRRELRSEYSSIYAAPGEFAQVARAALANPVPAEEQA